jgi:hypothetical protein
MYLKKIPLPYKAIPRSREVTGLCQSYVMAGEKSPTVANTPKSVSPYWISLLGYFWIVQPSNHGTDDAEYLAGHVF